MKAFLARWRAIIAEPDWHLAALVLGIMEVGRGLALGHITFHPALLRTLPGFGGYEVTLGAGGWSAVMLAMGTARLYAVQRDSAKGSAVVSFIASSAFGFLAVLGILTTALSEGPALVHFAVATCHSLASGLIFLRAQRAARRLARMAA